MTVEPEASSGADGPGVRRIADRPIVGSHATLEAVVEACRIAWAVRPYRRETPQLHPSEMLGKYLTAALDRTGRLVLIASIVLGVLAGLGVSQVRGAGEVWVPVGAGVALLVDLILITPVRLWFAVEKALAKANAELLGLRNAPAAGIRVDNVERQFLLQTAPGTSIYVTVSSETVIDGITFDPRAPGTPKPEPTPDDLA